MSILIFSLVNPAKDAEWITSLKKRFSFLFMISTRWHTMGQDSSKCKETLSHSECYRFWIVTSTQKTGEPSENIKFSLVTKLFLFCFLQFCLFFRGPNASSCFWGFFTFWAILAYCVAPHFDFHTCKHTLKNNNKRTTMWPLCDQVK